MAITSLTAQQHARRVVDTHVHVWPLDDAPGHRPAADARIRAPKAAAPVEWLVQDMDEYGIQHCVLVQSSAFGWDNTYMVECLERYPGLFRAIGLVDPLDAANAGALERWVGRGSLASASTRCTTRTSRRGSIAGRTTRCGTRRGATGAIMQFHIRPHHAVPLARMIERHPSVRVVIDHIGKPDVVETPPYASFQPVWTWPASRTRGSRSATTKSRRSRNSRGVTPGRLSIC